MAISDPFVELRFKCPTLVVGVLDAVSAARRVERSELANEILQAWADQQMREATAILRVTGTPFPAVDGVVR
jgi:hypothetical protein